MKPACFLHHQHSSHRAVTRHHPETRLLALAQDADLAGRRCSIRGDNQETGLVRR